MVNKSKVESRIIYSLLLLTLGMLVWMYVSLDDSVNETAHELLEEKNTLVRSKIDAFFNPVVDRLESEWIKANHGAFHELSQEDLAKEFFAICKSSPSISSVYISDDKGNQFYAGRIEDPQKKEYNGWFSAKTTLGNKTEIGPDNRTWFFSDDTLFLDSAWTRDDSDFDPRTRPWFISAIESDKAIWTAPYMFVAAGVPGISISKRYTYPRNEKRIISMDITLKDLSLLTTKMEISKNGKAFVLTEAGSFVGIPRMADNPTEQDLLSFALSDIDSFYQKDVVASHLKWKEMDQPNTIFEFKESGDLYWAKYAPYKVGNLTFYACVIIPQEDLMGPINKSKNMILFGMIFIVIISIVIVQAYRSKNKSNLLLAEQKKQIEEQKYLVEEKNQEIIDSINYAKRIQSAILPPDEMVAEYFPQSFIFYAPKDIVAGDFYWMNTTKNEVLIAAADCTGHGVPGALVSVVCNNSLNRSVNEFKISEPGKILDKTRELVIAEFEKSKEEVKDGMDIALISLQLYASNYFDSDQENSLGVQLKYAGAHNPLWLVRKGATEVEEIKANKQPIGKFDQPQPYETHALELHKGDTFYLFSDGFADQFGGEKGKKFKSSNFKKLLLSIQDLNIEEQKTAIVKAFEDWKGNFEQLDDVCVIGVRV